MSALKNAQLAAPILLRIAQKSQPLQRSKHMLAPASGVLSRKTLKLQPMSIDSGFARYSGQREFSSEQSSTLTTLAKNLPDRQQVEKYLYRFLVIAWDVTQITYEYGRERFVKYVWQNPKVQKQVKIFLDKMDEARKNK